MKVFTKFNPPPSLPTPVVGESKTRQEFLNESLTSTIIERFTRTGVLVPPGMARREPMFGDFTEIPDGVQDAANLMIRVRDDFARLPSNIRERFSNNPLMMYAFLSDERNRDEAISIGLVAKPKAVAAETSAPTDKPTQSAEENKA